MGQAWSRRAVLGGAVALTTGGCSLQPVNFGSETPTPSASADADPAKVVDPEFFVRSREGSAKRLPEGAAVDQRISTPHLDGTLREYFVGDRLAMATAAQVGEPTGIRAPDGYELVAFTLQGGLPGFLLTAKDAVEVQLVVGPRVVPVANLFDKFQQIDGKGQYLKEWEMFAFCVPTGAPVRLQISNAGITVAVDIRTGVPAVDDAWKATTGFRERWKIACEPVNGVFSRQFTTLPPAELEPDVGTLQIGLMPDVESGLLPWIPTLGWAPAGQQWLAVPMRAKLEIEGAVFPQLNLDVAASFQYQDQAGTKVAAVSPKSVTTEAISREQVDLIVIWPVSGRDATALITFNAVGPIEVDYKEVQNMPAQFTSAATPLDFTLTYTPK